MQKTCKMFIIFDAHDVFLLSTLPLVQSFSISENSTKTLNGSMFVVGADMTGEFSQHTDSHIWIFPLKKGELSLEVEQM